MKLNHPLPSGRATDGWGPRKTIPGVINAGFHHGQDWAAPPGTPIRAAAPGTVWANYFDPKGGWMVILKHPWGYTSYQHMREKAKLAIGQYVNVGQHIGNVGSSGASTGPHLHFEVWRGGRPYAGGTSVDPMTYLAPKPAPKPKPKPAPGAPTNTESGGTKMFMIYLKNGAGKNQHLYAVVGSRFWLEFSGQAAANNLIRQITGNAAGVALEVSKDFWNHCKRAATTGKNR